MMTQENIPYTADEIKAMVKTCEKYNEALERASKLKVQNPFDTVGQMVEHIFPELKESEDERMLREIKRYIKEQGDKPTGLPNGTVPVSDMIAWVEKQGNKPVNIDVESMVSSYEQRLESQGGTKYTPLVTMCLTAFRHGVENVLEELNLKKLEKQGEQMTKPKFKVGDWITDGSLICKVLGVTGKSYELHLHNDDYCHFETDIQSVDKYYRLWTIEDAKDGDVLVAKDVRPFIFTGEFDVQDDNPTAYCGINSSDKFITGNGSHWTFKDGIKPATKEQRDLLFSKMKEAGYEWDSEKKELKKMEVASKESKDERIKKTIYGWIYTQPSEFFDDGFSKEEMLAWLEKQESYYTFEIKEGHWYKCVCDYMLNGSDLMFKNDSLYYCRRNWRLTGEIDERNVKDIGVNGYKSFFRPATNQEIKDWLEKQGEKKPNSQMEKCSKCQFVYTGYCDGTCILKNNEYDKDMLGAIEYCKKNNRPLEKEHLAWLEKQGEKKSCITEEPAPKFKAGNKVIFTNGNVEKIVSVGTHGYTFEDGDWLTHEFVEKDARLYKD